MILKEVRAAELGRLHKLAACIRVKCKGELSAGKNAEQRSLMLKRVGFKLRKAAPSQNTMLAKLNTSYARKKPKQ